LPLLFDFVEEPLDSPEDALIEEAVGELRAIFHSRGGAVCGKADGRMTCW
jgi:hypothetical protein